MVKTKSKRIKVHDEATEISASQMLSFMKDTSDITGQLQKGPRTREDMELLESAGLERFFAVPARHYGCSTLKDVVKRNLYLYAEVPNNEEDEESLQYKLKLEDLVEDDTVNPNTRLAELGKQLKSNTDETFPVNATPTYVAKSFKGITPRVKLKPRIKAKKVSLPTETEKSENVYDFEEEEDGNKAELLEALQLQASPEKKGLSDGDMKPEFDEKTLSESDVKRASKRAAELQEKKTSR